MKFECLSIIHDENYISMITINMITINMSANFWNMKKGL